MDEEEIVTLREQYRRAGLPVPSYKIIYGRKGEDKPEDFNANPKQVNRKIRQIRRGKKGCADFWLWSWCFRWRRKKSTRYDVEESADIHDPYILNDLSGESSSDGSRRSLSKRAKRAIGRSVLRNCYYIQVATANAAPIGPPPVVTARM